MTAVETNSRPHVPRRADYRPTSLAESFIVPLLRREIGAALAAHAAPRAVAGGRALDVGCGRQPFRADLEAMGFAYLGQDVQQNPEGTVDAICPIDQPVAATLRDRGPFAFILCTEVLEHVADWHVAFANFRSLLAPGGRMLITCPFVYPLHEEPYDFWRPTPYALQHFARLAGLNVLEQRRAGSGWDVLGTTLGSVQFQARGTSLARRMLRNLAAAARKGAVAAIRSRWVRGMADIGPGVYLSNVIVLERPAATAERAGPSGIGADGGTAGDPTLVAGAVRP